MLESLLRKEICEKGPLSQSRFMELALHHPTYGYYRSQEAISRDFTTSPEISQMFGELLGAWAIECYHQLEHPKSLCLVELGPGKGTLMNDFLRTAQLSPHFFEALRLYLVEINPLLKAIQTKTISSAAIWVEQFEDIPCFSDSILIIANEFFDVFPTNTYIRKNNILYERCIEIKSGKLVFTDMVVRESKGPDQIWEQSPQAESYMTNICLRLLKQKGIFLCLDYGYEHGSGESLQALFEGEQSDPLCHVGRSDLTCHVNFGRLKEIALSHGLSVCGPIAQGEFLKNIGLEARLNALKQKNPFQAAKLEIAAIRLTHPQQMGALFKVMAVFSPFLMKPVGFDHAC